LALTGITGQWELESGGNDANGAYFNTAAAGIDYSVQSSPQLSLTDIVTNGTTTLTSATGGFTAAMIGNGINIAGTVYEIKTRVDTNTITVDRTIGAASGQTGKVGGAALTLGYLMSQAVVGNTVYCLGNGGAYSFANGTANTAGNKVSMTVGGDTSIWVPFWIVGYATNRTRANTDASRPIFQAGAASMTLLDLGAQKIIFLHNIDFDGNSGSFASTRGLVVGSSASGARVSRCKFRNWGNNAISSTLSGLIVQDCDFTTNPSVAFAGRGNLLRCDLHANTATPVSVSSTFSVVRCNLYGNTGASTDGIAITSGDIGLYVRECSLYGNGRHGINITANFTTQFIPFENLIITGNGGYGVAANAATNLVILDHVATFNNTSGRSNNINAQADVSPIILTASPFTNANAGDLSLNATAGGGAAVRAAGIPGTYPAGTTVNYLDIGAAQHKDAGGILLNPGMSGGLA
jgi:hypothetical protein